MGRRKAKRIPLSAEKRELIGIIDFPNGLLINLVSNHMAPEMSSEAHHISYIQFKGTNRTSGVLMYEC